MVRPREDFDQHLIDAVFDIDPLPADVRWVQDVFGNAVAIATFDRRARVQHDPAAVQDVDIEDYARTYPFIYASEEMPDLLRSIGRRHHGPLRQIDQWARRFVHGGGTTDTLAMPTDMTVGVDIAIDRDATARLHSPRKAV